MRKTLLFLTLLCGVSSSALGQGDATFRDLRVTRNIRVGGLTTTTVDARTIASNGVGTPATLTLTPTGTYVALTCNDVHGCTITMGESGMADGMSVTIANLSANACTFADTAGVSELNGAYSMAQYTSLSLQYATDRWVEQARSATGVGAGTVTTTGSPASGNLTAFSGAASITNTNLTGDVTTTDTVATTIAAGVVTLAKMANIATDRLIGRDTAGTGVNEALTVGGGIEFTGSAGIQRSALTGDVTATAGSAATTIANDAVTYAKMQNTAAATRLLCRGTAAGAGDLEECTLGAGMAMAGTVISSVVTGSNGGDVVGPASSVDDRIVTFDGATGKLVQDGGQTIAQVIAASGGVTWRPPDGLRLSLTTNTYVTTTDVTGAATLYWTTVLSGGNGTVTCFDGAALTASTITQKSLALGTLTADANYNVYWDCDGAALAFGAVWTNGTTPSETFADESGAVVLSSDHTKLYLGVIRTTATTTTEDSFAKRLVWNAWNQTRRGLFVADTTASWTYSTATWQQARATATNQLAYVSGDVKTLVAATVTAIASQSGTNQRYIAIGIDSTTTPVPSSIGLITSITNSLVGIGTYEGHPGVGYHTIVWLEAGTGTGTTTWIGAQTIASVSMNPSHIAGVIWN